MPLYVYKCGSCGHEFEEIVPYIKRDDQRSCKQCGKDSKRVEVTPFGFSVKGNKGDTLVSEKEIDRAVGQDAEKKWGRIEEGRKKRWSGLNPKPVDSPKGDDGKYRPVSVLGDQKVRGLRKEYSEALAEHRAERTKRGEGQFDGPGAISE